MSITATVIFNLLVFAGGSIAGVNWLALVADLKDRYDTANLVALALLFLGGVGGGFFLIYGGLENLYFINRKPAEAPRPSDLPTLWPEMERLSPAAQRKKDLASDVYPLVRGGTALAVGTLLAAAIVLYLRA